MRSLSKKIFELKGSLSYRKMAEKTGVSHNYLSNLIRGVDPRTGQEIQPSVDTLKKIAEAFPDDTNYEELMELAGYTQKKTSNKKYWELNNKDLKDVGKELDDILSGMETDTDIAFYGEPMDEETKALVAQAIESNLKMARELAKKKYTRKDYREQDGE